MSSKHELWELQSMQAAPLSAKISMTKQRIREWVNEYGEDGVYVSFSGGKDSTVLLHLVREMYGDSIPAVYCNTGLEYPEITQFVKTFDNVEIIKPKKNFFQVCEQYGFPLISKEVSECVSGARKYLKQVLTSMEEDESALTDRQTDHKWHYQKYRQLCGQGEYSRTDKAIWKAVSQCQIGGGGPARDFANLTGIRTNKPREVDPRLFRGFSLESDSTEPQKENRGGNASWRFGAVTGVLTTQNTIDARLYKNHRQFASATPDGDKQQDGQSDDGEYP